MTNTGNMPAYRVVLGFPGGTSGKEPTCQCRRHMFDPWLEKIPWRKAWQPTPVFLPGESHGQRSLVGYSPQSHKKLDVTEATQLVGIGLAAPWQVASSPNTDQIQCLLHWRVESLSLSHWGSPLGFFEGEDGNSIVKRTAASC